MSHWDDLPPELHRLIFWWRQWLILFAVTRIQASWRTYRIRLLLTRFRTLRYLFDFRAFNPSAAVFLQRTRL